MNDDDLETFKELVKNLDNVVLLKRKEKEWDKKIEKNILLEYWSSKQKRWLIKSLAEAKMKAYIELIDQTGHAQSFTSPTKNDEKYIIFDFDTNSMTYKTIKYRILNNIVYIKSFGPRVKYE